MSSLVALWCAVSTPSDDGSVPHRAREYRDATVPADTVSPHDAALVARIRAGDESAFRECYEMWYPKLWRFAVRMLASHDAAQDVVQDVFYSLFAKRNDLAIRGSLRQYLYGAVRHRALNLLRHATVAERVATTVVPDTEVPAMGQPSVLPDDLAQQRDIEIAVTRALATLPERQRSAMILRWEHGMTTAEIARTLGVADTVAGRLLLKAAAQLRKILTG